ncbi:MAG: two-component regulator propeller domain-containing protein, partial [Rhodothermales bacterium]
MPNLIVEALHEDDNGVIWAGLRRGTRAAPQEGGVYGFQGGRFEPVTQAGRPWLQQITMIFSDPNDAETLWFGTYESELRGWWSYRDGVLKPFPAVEMGDARHHLLRGPDGALWRIQAHWVYRSETPVLLTQGNQRLLSFDREGNLWVAGLGLHRLQRRALRTISEAEGVGRNLYPILEDRAGRIWLGSWSEPGLARLDGGAVTTYEVDSCCVTSLHEDRAGMLWVGTIAGACRMQGGRCVSFDLRPVSANSGNSGVRAMLEDRQERFWIGTEHGLFLGRLTEAGRSWTHFTIETGLTSNWVRAIVETRDGDVLFGTNGGGIMRYRDDDTFEAFTTAEGLASDYVRDIYEDDSGILWIATEDRGLCRLDRRGSPPFQGAGLVCLNADDGLFDNSLHRILEDDYGRFWFNTNRGIFWVEHAELNAFARGEVASVTSVAYTERDGMRNREGNGGVQPAGIKASDGRL